MSGRRRKRKQSSSLIALFVLAAVIFIATRGIGGVSLGSVYASIAQTAGDTASTVAEQHGIDNIQISEVTDVLHTQSEEPNTPSPANPDDTASSVYVDFIDVGQGDSILVVDEDVSMLIDTGYYEGYDNVQSALKDYNVSKVDILVLTHPDADHIQNAPEIIADYDVSIIYMPNVGSDSKTFESLMNAIAQYNVEVVNPNPGDVIALKSAKATVLGPVDRYEEANSNSIILKLINGNDSFLFTGDATGEETDDIFASGYDLEADVYKAAHHGSANHGSNSEKVLNNVSPEYMIISCGMYNDYGHPHVETMDLAKSRGIKVYRTDLQGSISCVSTGNGIIFAQEPTTDYRNGNNM